MVHRMPGRGASLFAADAGPHERGRPGPPSPATPAPPPPAEKTKRRGVAPAFLVPRRVCRYGAVTTRACVTVPAASRSLAAFTAAARLEYLPRYT